MLVGEGEQGDDDDLFGKDEARSENIDGKDNAPEDELEEDLAPKRISPDPGQPTEQEVSEHNVDHMPYRSWCEFCVKGRGTGEQHRESSGSSIPIIAFDYLFATDKGLKRRAELEGDEDDKAAVLKILVVKDSKSKTVFAHAVPQKGVDADGYAVVRLVEDIRWLGYTKILLKADNEHAIVKLLHDSLRRIKTDVLDMEQVGKEHPPSYDSRSNGSVENAVKAVQGLLRTVKLGFEARVGQAVPLTHPVMAWMAEHVAWILTTRKLGADGRSPYHSVRGRPFTRRLLEFGETALYKLPTKGPRYDERGKLEERWRRGVFLGFARQSNEYVLWDEDKVVKSRSHQRLKSSMQWPEGAHEGITADPHSTYASLLPERFGPAVEKPDEVEVQPKRLARSVAIRKADWETHGATPGCSKCSHAVEYGWGLMDGPHSEACVARFRELFMETEAGRQRVQRADSRRERQVQGGERQQAGDVVEPRRVVAEPQEETRKGEETHPILDRYIEEQQSADAVNDADDLFAPSSDEDMTPVADGDADMAMVARHDFDLEVLNLVDELGGSRGGYRRDRKKQLKALVSELYSPPRVTNAAKLLPSLKAMPGYAFDLTTSDENGVPWDFDIPERRAEAKRRILEQRPVLLVGSPMCTAFSTWQHLNATKGDPVKIKEAYTRAMVHLQFSCEMYEIQVSGGRYFLHEHPDKAMSWKEWCITRIGDMDGVGRTTGDQCQYGQATSKGEPIQKPTGWMSNSPWILRALSRRCQGRGGQCSRPEGGRHVWASGAVGKAAAIYPFNLCKAILQGLKKQLTEDGYFKQGTVGIQAKWLEADDDVEEYVKNAQAMAVQGELTYRDALTGQPLIPALVQEARRKELQYFAEKAVWKLRPRAEAYASMGKPPITVKWVDVNKGDDDSPNYRSRLVAREIRLPGEASIFAPTPPLEALRTVLSMAATNVKGLTKHVRDGNSELRTQVAVIDISRAYFNAKKDSEIDPTYVDLPPEDPAKAKGMCGLLQVHMYGTRAAAEGWWGEYSDFLIDLGFKKGDASACVFRHEGRNLVTSVHGDDFTIAGPKVHIDWMRRSMEAKYELTETGRIGPGQDDGKELKVLNRIVRWMPGGIEYEADPRQAERVVENLGLRGAKTVGSPGVKVTADMELRDKPLDAAKHTPFRAVAARCNYVSSDRPDIQFSSKEICRWMANPTESGVAALRRLGRYIEGHKRLIYEYPWQEAESVEVYSDTDWAGCIKTRKSTSGGCLLLGRHLIKSWSSTQGLISLSSGEAEFYGVTKASGIALGYKSLLRDLGVKSKLRVWTDSSATVGICGRQGLGKLRHIDTRNLWIQQKLRCNDLEIWKVRGEVNPGDLFTKHLSSEDRIHDLLKLFGCRFADGRPESAPKLRESEDTKPVLAAEGELKKAEDLRYELNKATVEHNGYVYPGTKMDDLEGGQEVWVPDAYLHPAAVLPHLIPGNLEALFPKVMPADERREEHEEPMDWLEQRAVDDGSIPGGLYV